MADFIEININDTKTLPQTGIEVIGYNEKWIDEDFNPDGTRLCFLQDEEDNTWFSACWCNTQDHWQTLISGEDNKVYHPYNDNNSDAPTHWTEKPKIYG